MDDTILGVSLEVLDMGWLRLVGSIKLYVSFAEYCLFYRALLQKRPIIVRSLLIVATSYLERETSCHTPPPPHTHTYPIRIPESEEV